MLELNPYLEFLYHPLFDKVIEVYQSTPCTRTVKLIKYLYKLKVVLEPVSNTLDSYKFSVEGGTSKVDV